MSVDIDLDDFIDRITVINQSGGLESHFSEQDLAKLLMMCKDVFFSQPPFLEVEAPIKVLGDTHGQFPDLIRLFNRGGFPPACNYLFLGDYIDRGKQSIEVMCLLMAYKCKYPVNFFLLRGNHECAAINRVYGFYDECRRRYSVKLWKLFQNVFNVMPFCALIESKIFCMHGGLSPDIDNWDMLRNIERPVDPPDRGVLCDLLWADPDKAVKGYQTNSRGVSYVFGSDILDEFCKKMGVDLIARAHQVVQISSDSAARRTTVMASHEGVKSVMGGRRFVVPSLPIYGRAPHYCGEFDNAAGMMIVNDNLLCSFDILRPASKNLRITQRPASPPRR